MCVRASVCACMRACMSGASFLNSAKKRRSCSFVTVSSLRPQSICGCKTLHTTVHGCIQEFHTVSTCNLVHDSDSEVEHV